MDITSIQHVFSTYTPRCPHMLQMLKVLTYVSLWGVKQDVCWCTCNKVNYYYSSSWYVNSETMAVLWECPTCFWGHLIEFEWKHLYSFDSRVNIYVNCALSENNGAVKERPLTYTQMVSVAIETRNSSWSCNFVSLFELTSFNFNLLYWLFM